MTIHIRVLDPQGQSVASMAVATFPARVGRNPENELAVDGNRFPSVSNLHAEIDMSADGAILTPKSTTNKTLVNDQIVSGPTQISTGDRIRLGMTGPTIQILDIEITANLRKSSRPSAPSLPRPTAPTNTPMATPMASPMATPSVPPAYSPPPSSPPPYSPATPPSYATAPPPVPASGSGRKGPPSYFPTDFDNQPIETMTVSADPAMLAKLRQSLSEIITFELNEGGIIGRDETATFRVDSPNISRRHARISEENGQYLLTDLGSANGTFLNGKVVKHSIPLKPGDKIDVGPYSLVFDGRMLASASRVDNVELVGKGLKRVVTDRATGKPLPLLQGINIVIKPREFVCLLGPSGSGKSTLLTMLSGRAAPTGGNVLVNGQDLYANFDALKQDIAVVPQKDVLHNSLAVGSALKFTAQLRLPPDSTKKDIQRNVDDMLGVVALSKRSGTLIRDLSGGQLKRASLANELISRPSLLFLDEVTSGLDEQTDRDMMELFRQIADGGKTVVCITHNLTNVEATCHLVVILTEGGRLAFMGTPDEAKSYFGIARLGDVYRKLAEHKPEHWAQQYRNSPYFQNYVRNRMPGYEDFESEETTVATGTLRTKANPVRQAKVLTTRYASIWKGDVAALGAMLGQSLLVALLLGLVFGYLGKADLDPMTKSLRTLNLVFLLNVSCFWLGCNNAAKELVRERVIYDRERDFNLRLDSYLFSKFSVLMLIGLGQATLLYLIAKVWCSPQGAFVGQYLTLCTLMAAGTALGLAISALSPTEEVASALVPVAVIPQIILAGQIVPLEDFSNILGKAFITCHWGHRTFQALSPEEIRKYADMKDIPFLPQLLVIGIHAVIFLAVATVVMFRRGKR